jgi:hypothetical protein
MKEGASKSWRDQPVQVWPRRLEASEMESAAAALGSAIRMPVQSTLEIDRAIGFCARAQRRPVECAGWPVQ